MQPKVSVIMAAFRERENHLKEAISSVLNQTYRDFELIIVLDDPSNVALEEIIREFAKKDERVKFFKNDVNRGAHYARNRAAQNAHGEYLAITDGDDVSLPDRFEKEVKFLDEHPEIAIVSSARNEIDENGKFLRENVGGGYVSEKIPSALEGDLVITHPAAMMRANSFSSVGGYRNVPAAEDYDMILQCVSRGYGFAVIDEPLLNYRITSGSLSHANHAKTWVGAQYCRKLYSERKKTGKDGFSAENYAAFASKSVLKNDKSREKFNREYVKFDASVNEIKSGNKIKGVIGLIGCFLRERELVTVFTVYAKIRKKRREAMRK